MSAEVIMVVFNYDNNQFILEITRAMEWEDVMVSVRLRLDQFNGFNKALSFNAVSLIFSAGNVETILLDNDEDLECLLAYARQLHPALLNVKVHVNNELLEYHDSSDDTDEESHNESSDELSNDEYISDDNQTDEENVPDYLEKYCKHVEKFLRTEPWKQAIKSVGQIFDNGGLHFKIQLTKFAIVKRFEFIFVKNDTTRVKAVYKFKKEGCGWFVITRYDKVHDYFSIRKLFNEHTCNRSYRILKNYRMLSTVIADEIKDYFKTKATVSPKDIRNEWKNTYGLDISYMQAWRGVEIAKNWYYGQITSTYDQLRSLRLSTMKFNPDSQIFLEHDVPNSRFQRFFISYGPCIEGFNFCRPLLFLDGTHLKSRYKGVLLAATGKDANKGLYPLGIAIVDSETEDNWTWFLERLTQCLKGDRKITFISDRNKGLMEAVTKVFPDSPHGFCMLHLRANLKDRLSGTSREVKSRIVELLWKAAQTPSREECNICISDMLVANEDVVQGFLNTASLENWANSYFDGKRYGELYSNVAESFNAWIRVERNLPVKTMLDDIRRKIMTRMAKRRKLAPKVTIIICPKYTEWLGNASDKGVSWEINPANEDVYEVMSTPSVVVNLKERACTCGLWQIRCFPCSHSIAAILYSERDVMDYVEDYYKAKFWFAAHARTVFPIPSLGEPVVSPEDMVIQPPITKTPPGRPKKRRFESRSSKHAKKRPMKCSRCNNIGYHNKKTCNASIN